MKMKYYFAAMFAAAALTACNNEDTPAVQGADQTQSEGKSFIISVTGGAKTRAVSTEPGVGDENTINEWAVITKSFETKKYVVTKVDTGGGTATGTTSAVEVTGVAVDGGVFVLANYDGRIPLADSYETLTAVEALKESISKSDLNNYTVALQASSTNPTFNNNGNDMLMFGEVTPTELAAAAQPTATGSSAQLKVKLNRQLAKGEFTVLQELGTDAGANGVKSLNSISDIYVRRVVPFIQPFAQLAATDYMAVDENEDTSSDNTTSTSTTDYRFVFTGQTIATPCYFYTTPNYGILTTATAVIVKANITYTGDDGNDVTADRYFKAFLSDSDVLAYATEPNNIYRIEAKVNGKGQGSEKEALDTDAIDVQVTVEVADWTVHTNTVEMD